MALEAWSARSLGAFRPVTFILWVTGVEASFPACLSLLSQVPAGCHPKLEAPWHTLPLQHAPVGEGANYSAVRQQVCVPREGWEMSVGVNRGGHSGSFYALLPPAHLPADTERPRLPH